MAEEQHIRLLRRKAVGAIDLRKRRRWFDEMDLNGGDKQETPPETPPSEGSSDSWLDSLPSEAQAEIKKLRSESAEKRIAAREAQKQLDALKRAQEEQETSKLAEQQKWQELYEKEKAQREQLSADLETQRVKTLKLTIAAEAGLPPQLAARLQGNDEETLRADAAELSKLIPSGSAPADDQKTPARSQTTSAVPDGQPTRETDDQRRARLNPRFKSSPLFDSVDVIVHDD